MPRINALVHPGFAGQAGGPGDAAGDIEGIGIAERIAAGTVGQDFRNML